MATPDCGLERVSGNSELISVAVSEYVAARRLGLSVDTLRRDRRLGHLGIPFIKYGAGKHGTVRYDLVDLDRWVETKKQRRVAPAPLPPTPEPPPERPFEPPRPEPEIAEPPVPLRIPPRPPGPWDALISADDDTDPFAAASRAPARRQGSGYWGH
jgi:hypothetical protein